MIQGSCAGSDVPDDLQDDVPDDDSAALDVDGATGAQAERRVAEVPADTHGQRLDRWLARLVPEFSRTYLQRLIERGCVKIDGAACVTASRRLQAGQQLQIVLEPTPESRAFVAQPMDLHIVHEDADLIVLNKPAGLVVHPAAGNWSGTLLNGLLAHHRGAGTLPRAGIVHRLDKDTSGLMVVAKTAAAMTALTRAIAAREVGREYLAIVHGCMAWRARRFDGPVGRDARTRVRMAVTAAGKPAQTDVAVLAVRQAGPEGEACALLHCRLHTGRTHQIRVHLSHAGHPLLGDALYGGKPAWGMQRQALHAARLTFCHPRSTRRMTWQVAPPPDMAQAIGRCWPSLLIPWLHDESAGQHTDTVPAPGLP